MPLTLKHQDEGSFLLFGHQCSSAWLHGFYSGRASIITFSDTLQWFGLVPCLAVDKTQFRGRLFPSTTGLCKHSFHYFGGNTFRVPVMGGVDVMQSGLLIFSSMPTQRKFLEDQRGFQTSGPSRLCSFRSAG